MGSLQYFIQDGELASDWSPSNFSVFDVICIKSHSWVGPEDRLPRHVHDEFRSERCQHPDQTPEQYILKGIIHT